jgi:hypothetical protein
MLCMHELEQGQKDLHTQGVDRERVGHIQLQLLHKQAQAD